METLNPYRVVCYAVIVVAAQAVTIVPTPFGQRPAACVLEVPSGSHVQEDLMSNDVIISHPTLGTWRHTADPMCSEAVHAPKPSRHSSTPTVTQNNNCSEPPCTCDALPCNNWIDNAGWMMDPFDKGPYIGGFSTVMSVPGSPKQTGGQTLFYFPGAENTDGTPRHGDPAPSGRAILQPVLTYGPETNCVGSTPRSKTGWCIASWYCCPKNLTVHSPYLGDVMPGDEWLGLFNLTTEDTFETVSRNTKTGQETKLACPRQGRNFNWADVTLEIYSVDSCPAFATGPIVFRTVNVG
eukprot:m.137767 g.137767  ORF g.137767 m.137767 type:complete len:295 (+) comp29945_c0_seq1:111-995(+)